ADWAGGGEPAGAGQPGAPRAALRSLRGSGSRLYRQSNRRAAVLAAPPSRSVGGLSTAAPPVRADRPTRQDLVSMRRAALSETGGARGDRVLRAASTRALRARAPQADRAVVAAQHHSSRRGSAGGRAVRAGGAGPRCTSRPAPQSLRAAAQGSRRSGRAPTPAGTRLPLRGGGAGGAGARALLATRAAERRAGRQCHRSRKGP